ncbi:MAG: nickel-dependent lactate racemase, partial [Caldilineaceae bacterium]|nr:nickel-dependent lactate racemase [Caldilineaceae bacterium]
MNIHLQYGHDGLTVDVPGTNVTVLSPRFVPGLPDEHAAFVQAVRTPIDAPPLRTLVNSSDRVAIVIADITRPLPSDRLLPWILTELAHVDARNVAIIIGNGTHRACTPAEIELLVGPEIARDYRVINHNAYDPATLAVARAGRHGHADLKFNRAYVEADKRIVVGFIEPHFMAGYSGGYKGIFPGIADIDSIMHYHRAEVIGDPRSTWGVLENNPTQAQIRANGAALPVDFCINVTLNHERGITGFYCGDVITAHEIGCGFVKETAMVACPQPFPLIITTNSGYPLDQNLYQTVKGMCAAAEVIQEGGDILVAARCNDGFPAHGNFTKLLYEHPSPEAL